MKTINLREYYPTIYRRDHLISLPDAVAAALHEGKASEVAYQVRVFRNKAYYSLEWAEARVRRQTLIPFWRQIMKRSSYIKR